MRISSHSVIVSLELKNIHLYSSLRILDASVHVDVPQRVHDITSSGYDPNTKNFAISYVSQCELKHCVKSSPNPLWYYYRLLTQG